MTLDEMRFQCEVQACANEHEILVLKADEFDQCLPDLERNDPSWASVQRAWRAWRTPVETVVTGGKIVSDNTLPMAEVHAAFGTLGAKVRYKSYAGKIYVMISGSKRHMAALKGTKYLASNAKMTAIGLGKGAQAGLSKAGIVGVVAISAIHVMDFLLDDEVTLAHLIGNLGTDLAKYFAAKKAGALALGAAKGAIIAKGVTVAALGPIGIAVVAGVGVAMGLAYLNKKFGITDWVVDVLSNVFDWVKTEGLEHLQNAGAWMADTVRGKGDRIVEGATEFGDRLKGLWRPDSVMAVHYPADSEYACLLVSHTADVAGDLQRRFLSFVSA